MRTKPITPYNDSNGPSIEHEHEPKQFEYVRDPKSVRIKSNQSKAHQSGVGDALYHALGHSKTGLPVDNHEYRPSSRVHPTGAHYNPAGEFGKRERTGAGRGVYSYGGNRMSARPSNAVGNPPERHGENAIGHPSERRGTNAVGNPPNRFGGNALASDFKPRFGFHGGARRS